MLASDPRSAYLAGFTGAASQGDWQLFVADLAGGSVHQLHSWTLTLDITPVPEPAAWAGLTAAGLAAFALLHRHRSRR